MKAMTAVKFRLLLTILMVIAVLIIASVFFFGYKYMQSVGEDTARRQADAAASEDSIGNLQRLQVQLGKLDGLNEKLSTLRSSSSLPQFDTEKSLRTIAEQLGLSIKNVIFIAADDTATTTPVTGTPTTQTPTTTKNSKISFEFAGHVSYNDLIRFLDAIETSTPKLSLKGISLPEDSTRSAIQPGTLTLELATS